MIWFQTAPSIHTRILFPLLKGSLKIAWGLQSQNKHETNIKNKADPIQKRKNNTRSSHIKNLLQNNLTIVSRCLSRTRSVVVPIGKLLWIRFRLRKRLTHTIIHIKPMNPVKKKTRKKTQQKSEVRTLALLLKSMPDPPILRRKANWIR